MNKSMTYYFCNGPKNKITHDRYKEILEHIFVNFVDEYRYYNWIYFSINIHMEDLYFTLNFYKNKFPIIRL